MILMNNFFYKPGNPAAMKHPLRRTLVPHQ